jgi:hypothetical protein
LTRPFAGRAFNSATSCSSAATRCSSDDGGMVGVLGGGPRREGAVGERRGFCSSIRSGRPGGLGPGQRAGRFSP